MKITGAHLRLAASDVANFLAGRRLTQLDLLRARGPEPVEHYAICQEAVGALMGRFARREDEVDDLFRLGVFVDLYRVVRQGVRAGVESYSIKRLEPLCGYDRQVDLDDATVSLIAAGAGARGRNGCRGPRAAARPGPGPRGR